MSELNELEERLKLASRRARESAALAAAEARKFVDRASSDDTPLSLGPFIKRDPCVCHPARGHNNGSTPSRAAKPCTDACAEDGYGEDGYSDVPLLPPEAPAP